MRVIGLGCRAGRPAETILDLIATALAGLPPAHGKIRLATSTAKLAEPGIAEAARRLGLPLDGFSPAALAAEGPRLATPSARVQALTGLPGVAEAAALAAVGPQGKLILPRITAAGVSCAIAEREA